MADPGRVSSPWIVSFPADPGARVRLICFPYAGGGASAYYPWARALAPDTAIHAVQLPGRESRIRESPARVLTDIVDPVAAEIEQLADRPIVLFGHSFGTVLAFETARRLRERRRASVAALIVSGRPAPHVGSRAPRLAHLPPRELVFQVADLYGGIPPVVLSEPELVLMMGTALQADLEILERYVHVADDPLSCPILAVGGSGDRWVTRSELDA